MKKIFKSLLAISMILTLVACGTPSEDENVAKFTPGTYTGTGQGNNGPIELTVTVDETSITAIEIGEHQETKGIAEIAFERVVDGIIDGQTLAVDTVATATYTSIGVLEAAEAALIEAGADIDALKQKSDGEEETEGETLESTYDVVVIGSGGAGLSAAISAQQAGAKVAVIEKMPRTGGNTIISGGGMNLAHPELQKDVELTEATKVLIESLLDKEAYDEYEASLQETVRAEYDNHLAAGNTWLFDSPSFHALQTYNGGDYAGNPELISLLCNEAMDTRNWLEDIGVPFADYVATVAGGLYHRGSTTGAGKMGTDYFAAMNDYYQANGIDVIFDATAEEILMKDGRAVGVRATQGNDTLMVTATKGVIIATGGFAANVEMRVKYNTEWPIIDASIMTTNSPAITGDGILMGEAVGANLINMDHIQFLPYGNPVNGGLDGLIIQQPENCIYVNKEGQRFVSEYERRDVMTKALLDQTDSYMYLIVDAKTYPTSDSLTHFSTTIGEEIAEGRSFGADTLEELAVLIGVEPETLVATVEKYNAGVDAGVDEFGKAIMNKIDQGPYYANPRAPTVHHTMGGLEITTNTEVVDTSGNIIPGLYAAGEVAGGVHGKNRLGGNALTDVFVFGKIAGEQAASGK